MTIQTTVSFGELLKEHRLAAGLTQEVLADRAGVSARSIQALERGASRPRRDTMQRLITALDPASAGRARFLDAATPAPRRRLFTAYNPPGGHVPSAPVYPGILPDPITALVGREQQVAAAAALLQNQPVWLLTLTGAGGVGKTRLALQVAAKVRDQFAHGVVFVPLAPIRDSTLVLVTIAQSLGVADTGDQPILIRLTTFLRDKQILLVLDNFEQVLDAANNLSPLRAACVGLRLLVTSRASLRLQGEHVFQVPPLPVPDPNHLPTTEALYRLGAVRLFIDRARAVRSDFELTVENAHDVAAICARLDGLPLAIELAAARVTLLPPAELLARLKAPLRVLTGGPRDLPERQQTIRNTIAWSYDLLTAHQRILFASLGIFVGGFTLTAAEAICSRAGMVDVDVFEGLSSLVDMNLICRVDGSPHPGTTESPRLLLLQTIREYALECLAASNQEAAVGHAHAAFYLASAETAAQNLTGSEHEAGRDHLETNHDNLRAALRWALDRNDLETALRLGSALWRFWHVRGYLSEGRRWLEEMLAAGDTRDKALPSRARVLNGAGVLAHYQGAYARAAMLCGESLTLARQLRDGAAIAAALLGLAHIARAGGNYAAAGAMYEEALPLLREVGDRWGIAYALLYLGNVRWWQADYVAARLPTEEGLALYRSMHNTQGIASALRMLGQVIHLQGDLATARSLYEESLALSRRIGDRHGLPRTLMDLASMQFSQANYQAAQIAYAEALVLLDTTGDKLITVACLFGVARILAARGQPHLAARLLAVTATQVDSLEAPLQGDWRDRFEHCLAEVRACLGDVAFTTAWIEGQAMTPAQAVATLPEPAGQDPACPRSAVTTALPVPDSSARAVLPGRSLAELSGREAEVLALVALGLRDAQVAAKLVISPRTVNSHLSSIYGKLGVTSRLAAVRAALSANPPEDHLV